MLQKSADCSWEETSVEVEDRFRDRINNVTAMAAVLSRYADTVENPDASEFAIIAMVANGISDMLMTAIDDFECNIARG